MNSTFSPPPVGSDRLLQYGAGQPTPVDPQVGEEEASDPGPVPLPGTGRAKMGGPGPTEGSKAMKSIGSFLKKNKFVVKLRGIHEV